MPIKKLAPSLLALSLLATPCAAAEPEPPAVAPPPAGQPAAPQPAAAAVDPGSVQALKDMGAELLKLGRFGVKTNVTSEVVLQDGQKLQQSAAAELKVQRPNRLHARFTSARAERELIYDGKTATLYTPALKFYAQAETADTIGAAIRRLKANYGIDVPLADLFVWGTDEAPLDKIESAMHAGQDIIGGEPCDHYAFRQAAIDWQIWIAAGKRPLPRKIVITNREDEARPQHVSLITWDLKPKFDDAVFTFTPPKDAKLIAIRATSGN